MVSETTLLTDPDHLDPRLVGGEPQNNVTEQCKTARGRATGPIFSVGDLTRAVQDHISMSIGTFSPGADKNTDRAKENPCDGSLIRHYNRD